MDIGFIGTGVMGASIVKHLLKAGHSVAIYTRTKAKAQPLIEEGAVWRESAQAVAEASEVVFTMVGYPSDVEEIYLKENGILAHALPGTVLIDMTTSQPALAKRIYAEAKERGLDALDAPVSGGDLGARNGILSVMVGGDEAVFERIRPVLELFGENIRYQGPAGAGQHTKMSNQVKIAGNMVAVCEALIYAKKAGLDPENVLKSITTGAAGSWSLSNLAPKMLAGDFEPGFYIKHFIKDMKIAAEEADALGLELPALQLALSKYEALAEEGYGDKGTQALYQLYDR